MDDEVNLENLDSLPDVVSDEDAGDIPVAQQVPAPQADHQADEAEKTAAAPADEALQGDSPAEADGAAETDTEAPTEDAGTKAVEEFSKSLRTLDGKWYVLHTYSGYEKRVKTNIESRVQSFGLEDQIFQVEVPIE